MFAIVMIPALLAGCGRAVKWTNSGAAEALDNEDIIRAAGARQGAAVSGHVYSRSAGTHFCEMTRHFQVTLASGTQEQLLAAYREVVRKTLEGRGADIYGEGQDSIADQTRNFRNFSYQYRWGENVGIVRAYSFGGRNGEVQIIFYCYEHRA